MAGHTRSDRRISSRYVVEIPAQLILPAEQEDVTILDLSASGAQVGGQKAYPVIGQSLTVEFSLFPGASPVRFNGEVVRMTADGNFGLRFTRLEDRMRQVLLRVLPRIATSSGDGGGPDDSVYSGRIALEVDPMLHQACAETARIAGMSLDEWLGERLEGLVADVLGHLRRNGGSSHDPTLCLECRRSASRG